MASVSVLSDNRSSLELALKDNYGAIVEDLNEEGLLKDDIYKIVKNPQDTSADKASIIVGSVLEYVQLESTNFDKFIRLLKKNGRLFADIIKKLEEAYDG